MNLNPVPILIVACSALSLALAQPNPDNGQLAFAGKAAQQQIQADDDPMGGPPAPNKKNRSKDKVRKDGPDLGGMDFVPGKLFHPKMVQYLGLTDDQKKKLQDYQFQQERTRIQQRAQMDILRLDLKQVLSVYPLDASKLEDIRKRMLKQHEEQVNQRFADIKFLSTLLTAEQHQKLMEKFR